MTVKEFIAALQGCYDYKNKPGQAALIGKWAQKIPADRLGKIFDEITGQISTEFGQVADLARVKKIYSDMKAAHRFSSPINAPQIGFRREDYNEFALAELDKLRKKLNIRS